MSHVLQGTPDIYDHEVTISAESYLPVDDTMIPTGIITLFILENEIFLNDYNLTPLQNRNRQTWFCVVSVLCTGEVKSVEKTLFDLRKPVLLGSRLKELPGPGFDHNFCLCSPGEPSLERKCARCVICFGILS